MHNITRTSLFALAAALAIGDGGAALAHAAATPQAPAEPAPARAAAPQTDENGEIIVNARKRDETLISVPVVVTAVGGAQLAAKGVTNLDGLARITPQLLAGNQGGAVQGGNIAIRGVSGPDQNPFGDQAVSFNVDGVQVTQR